jgi:acyl-CoA thioester hydrolase
MRWNETHLRVRYAETDQMGVVYHGSYLPWLEVGRVELLRSMGYHYKDLEAAGCVLAVAEVNVRYALPALYDDLIGVWARIKESNPRLVTIEYQVKRAETGELLASGYTKHIFLNKATLRPMRVPEAFKDAFIQVISESGL